MDQKEYEDTLRILGIMASPDDYDSAKKELKGLLKKTHPDKTGGAPLSGEQDDQNKRITSALGYIKIKQKEKNSSVPALVSQVTSPLSKPSVYRKLDAQIAKSQRDTVERSAPAIRKALRSPRLSSGILMAVSYALYSFSARSVDHPLIGPIFRNNAIQLMIVFLSFLFFIRFLLTWVSEYLTKKRIEYLLSEEGRKVTFAFLFDDIMHSRNRSFTFVELAECVRRLLYIPYLRFFYLDDCSAPISLIEEVANLHIARLEQHGAVKIVDTPCIDRTYEIDKDLPEIQGSRLWEYSRKGRRIAKPIFHISWITKLKLRLKKKKAAEENELF